MTPASSASELEKGWKKNPGIVTENELVPGQSKKGFKAVMPPSWPGPRK